MITISPIYITRTAIGSYTDEINSLLDAKSNLKKAIYTSSPSFSNFLDSYINHKTSNKYQLTYEMYKNRSIFRTTPFGIFSSVNFIDSKKKIENFKPDRVKVFLSSEVIFSIILFITLKNIKKMKLYKNINAVIDYKYFIVNFDPIPINEQKLKNKYVSINDQGILNQIYKRIPLNGIYYMDLYADFKNTLSESIFRTLITDLIKNQFILSNIMHEKNYKDQDYFLKFLKKSNVEIYENIKKQLIDEIPIKDWDINKVEKSKQYFKDKFNISSPFIYSLYSKPINYFNLKDHEKAIKHFSNFLNKNSINSIKSEKYQQDYYWILENFGNSYISYADILKIMPEKFLNYYDFSSVVEDETSIIKSDFSKNYEKYKNNKKIDLKKLFNFSISQKLKRPSDPTFQLSFYDLLNGKLQISPAIGSRESGSIEGRFSENGNFEYIQELISKGNIYKKMGFTPVFCRILSSPIKYQDLQKSVTLPNDYELSFNILGESNKQITFNDIYIRASKGLINIYLNKNNKMIPIYLTKNSTVNYEKLFPNCLKKLIYWNSNLFSNILSVFDMIDFVSESHDYNPPIYFENILIKSESWNPLIKIKQGLNKEAFKFELDKFVHDKKIPNIITIVTGDQHTPINLNSTGFEHIWNFYKKGTLFSFENNELFNRILNKNYKFNKLSEIIVNIHNFTEDIISDSSKNVNCIRLPYISNHNKKWTEFDIYLNEDLEDTFLRIFFTKIRQDNLKIKKYFFVKYFDSHHHIRLRVLSNDSDIIYSYLLNFYSSGIIQDLKSSIYIPETERYGTDLQLSLVEDYFCSDSRYIVNNIILNQGLTEFLKLETILTDVIIIILLSPVMEKINISRQDSASFQKYKQKIQRGYRKYQKYYLDLFFSISKKHSNYAKKPFCISLSKYFLSLEKLKLSDTDILFRVKSIIHMHINRVYGIKSYEEEYINFIIKKIFLTLSNS